MRKTKSVKKVMLINSQHSEECRAVVLDNNIIDNYIGEHSSREQIKGNIYLGVINRIEPSIEAAFVDFGGKKYGFLPFKELSPEYFDPSKSGMDRLFLRVKSRSKLTSFY